MGEAERESEACGRGDGDGGGGVAMETPQRNQITTSISKFEDSPVFNFINSLSPIKSVRSTHITQSFNSLNLASLPSVFTSPHVSSLKESRVLRRHHFPDPSKPEFSSENGDKEAKNEGSVVVLNTVQHQENIDPSVSVGEASVQSSYENSKLATELSGILVYDYVSTDCSSTPCCVDETKYVSEMSGMSSSLVPFVQNVSGKGLFSSDMHVEGQIDQNNDSAGSDWDNLISDAADLLIFDSPNNAETFKGSGQKSVDSGKRFCSSFINDLPKIQADGAVGAGEQYETENPSTQPGEGNYSNETAEAQGIPEENLPNNCVAGGMSVKMANESDSNLYRGTRRRCLVFEMAGAYRKHLDGCSSSGQPDGNIPTNDKQLASIRPKNDSPRCILPGIGLHLNALATTRKFSSAVNSEALVCREQGMSVPTSSASFSSLPTSEELSSTSLAVMITSEINTGPLENGVPVVEDTSQASGYVGNEELNQSSPKKKRRKLEYAGENEGCKRCNCKKSKCLKLYCECFAAGLYCVEPCSCLDCFNKPVYEDTVLATRKQIESRNPLAFAPKVIRSSDTLPETRDELNKTPASARHKRGCNCKKSGCLKKYCECYQGGVGCSINCRCEGCKNAFGRKDGSTLIGNEADLEEDAERCEKAQLDTNLQKAVIQNDAEQNLEGPPETPLRFGRQSVGLPFSSKSKPPRSLLSIGSSSGMSANQRLGKQNIFPPMSKLDNDFKTIPEDELPEILQASGSPSSVVKSSSPNSKRISPPHCEFESSPGRRSSRKLILKSIPSFPSLTPKH